jgi:phenylpropionate dioxygenase-like ring-hydroxylating dioxygenase large terminal subunit
MTKVVPGDNHRNKAFSGYFRRDIPAEDAEITRSGPGTPLGEYMRRFWQPVCLSDQLTDVPHAIRIMGEDLVAFRDKRGEVGVLHRHCCHRGASLEYGVIQGRGIRCCYHGIHFDLDGTIIEVPGEPDNGERLRQTVAQGAYPAIERDGLVFAYMGPPAEKPPFLEYDAFEKYDDTKLVPFTNVFPCNWLQTMDNIADQMHTYMLHNTAALYNGSPPEGLDVAAYTLSNAFIKLPVMDYMEVRNGTGMVFIAGRRVDDQKVWVRINDLIVPNVTQHAYLYEDGSERRLWHRVHMSRWYVPVDDTNSIIFGWRMFGKTVDPFEAGDESQVGWDEIDFLQGQVGNRPYEEGQRLPGDWEAIASQRPIAVHALENPTKGDAGVYMNRNLIRNAIRGKNPAATPEQMHERADAGLPSHCYTNNSVMDIPRRASEAEDNKMIGELGRQIVAIVAEGDAHTGLERDAFIRGKLEDLERGLQ